MQAEQAEKAVADQAAAAQELITTQDPGAILFTAVFMGLIGVVLLLFGYRLTRLTSKIQAGFLLAGVGYALFAPSFGQLPGIGIAVLLGIVGYKLGDIYYYLNVILFGLFAGAALGYIVGALVQPEPTFLYPVIGAVACAILAALFERPLGIFASAVLGSAFLCFAVTTYTDGQPIRNEGPQIGPLFAGLFALGTILGIIVQARTTKNLPDHNKVENKPAAQKQ